MTEQELAERQGGTTMGSQYLHNLAHSLMGQVGVADGYFGEYPAQDLYSLYGKAIHAQLRRMRPETLGKIAACGRGRTEDNKFSGNGGTSLYHVHCGTWLDNYGAGLTLLREIACTAVVAEMADILRSLTRTEPNP